MASHPNRGPKGPSSNPTPEQVRAAREASGLTQTEAAARIHATMRAWQEWEAGNRRMHPGLWELFKAKTSPSLFGRLVQQLHFGISAEDAKRIFSEYLRDERAAHESDIADVQIQGASGSQVVAVMAQGDDGELIVIGEDGRRRAPWEDFKGREIYEGDVIEHPSGDRGTVIYESTRSGDEYGRWRVRYGQDTRTSALCLQIGDKGMAVVVPRP